MSCSENSHATLDLQVGGSNKKQKQQNKKKKAGKQQNQSGNSKTHKNS